MSIIHELDPERHLKLVEGFEDILTPEARKLEAFYQAHRKCKRCGDMLRKEYDGRTAWEDGQYLAKALLKCDNCQFMIEPFSGVILNTGNPAKIPQPIMPVHKMPH